MTANSSSPSLSRRDFLSISGAVGASTLLRSAPRPVHPGGRETVRIGLVGCGGRGTGAVLDSARNDGVEVVALADLFQDRIDGCRNTLGQKLGDKMRVTEDNCFTGFDAAQKLVRTGVDVVLLATPPHFRPMQIRAAIEAGKHVFVEKPVAVDAPGIRSVLESARMADEKGLCAVAGTQRRHEAGYLEVMKRVHDGAIGRVTHATVHWNQGGLWMNPREKDWTDMHWQLRNWLYFTWLSGDHICEQHVHNLDVANWALRGHPQKASGFGGRQVRTDPAYGHIFDHFAVQYEYADGVQLLSTCRQIDNCANDVAEYVYGTDGRTVTRSGAYQIQGKNAFVYRSPDGELGPYQQEHVDLLNAIRTGKKINELRQVAESTLTAIMGRMATYTGQVITWEQALNSKEDLSPTKYEFGPLPVPPVAMPGRTKFV